MASPEFLVPNVDGWYGMRLIPASRATEIRGLAEIAAMVAGGAMPGDTPIFVATKRTDAPWPDVVVGVPLTVAELAAWRAGDRTVARDVVEALEEAYDAFMAQVKAGRVN